MIGDWLQRHRLSLLFVLVLLTFAGILLIFKLPVALFPTISFPRISVSVDAGDRPVDRMVVEVTRPVELALRTVPGVLNIRSKSSRGLAEFSLSFSWHTNMVIALLQTQGAINQIMPGLPSGTHFNAQQMNPNVFPVFGLALTSTQKTLVQLRDLADFQLSPLLSTIPGVSHVEVLGGKKAEFHVLVDPIKLRYYHLTFDDVSKALMAANVVSSVGQIEDYYRLYLILADTRLREVQDIQNTILHTANNGIVNVEDIAQVGQSTVPALLRVTANGHDAVLLNVMQQAGADTVTIVEQLKAELKNFQHKIAKDIQIKPYYDQSTLIEDAAHSVRDAIIVGAILAGIVLLFFLRNLSMTIVVALILPCVLATTALLLYLLNMSINIMTLGGMAAAVGLIIDDDVVMVEYLVRRLSKAWPHPPKHDSILTAALEMLRPLFGSSLATIVIFLPLIFLSGVAGGFFKALALTMAASLTISFFFAFLVVPLFGEFILRRADAGNIEPSGTALLWLQRHYRRIMRVFLPRTTWLMVAVMLIIGIGSIAYTQVGSGFMPHMDEGGFILDYAAKPGTSLTETDRLLRQVEKLIVATPEVDSYSRRTGLQLGGGLTETNTGDFFIHLKKPPRRNIETIMSTLREQIQVQVPGLRIETAQLMEDLIGDLTAVPQPIEIKIFGDNPVDLQDTANQVAHLLQTIPGVVEIFNGLTVFGDTVNIKVDRIKAAVLGLDSAAVTQQIQNQLTGNVVSQIQEGEKMIGIRLWTAENLHDRILQLQQLPIQLSNGHFISLGHIATMQIQRGITEVTREDLKSMLAVTARIQNRDLGSTMRDVTAKMQKLSLPPGISFKYGGLYQEQKKSFYNFFLVFTGAAVLVMLLLLFLYKSVTVMCSILLTVLLSLSGVFLGLWLTGTELNISAMMGMTMIIGIVTEIAIFYFAELQPESQYQIDELIIAGTMRMRPILMTSIIAIFALTPLALALGSGSTMQQPLAIAIIFGLIIAVPLVLFVMPAFYLFLSRLKRVSPS